MKILTKKKKMKISRVYKLYLWHLMFYLGFLVYVRLDVGL